MCGKALKANVPFAFRLNSFTVLPKSGTASDVAGIVSATIFKNTVNESNIVTPVKEKAKYLQIEMMRGAQWAFPMSIITE